MSEQNKLGLLPLPRHTAKYFEPWAGVYTSHEVESIRRDAIAAWNRRTPASEPAVDRDAVALDRQYLAGYDAGFMAGERHDYPRREAVHAGRGAQIADALATPAAPAVPAAPLVASEQQPVAWAVVSRKGGIHKLSVTRESAERKASAWQEEWPNNGCAVRPLVFADLAPQVAQASPDDATAAASSMNIYRCLSALELTYPMPTGPINPRTDEKMLHLRKGFRTGWVEAMRATGTDTSQGDA